MRTAIDIQTAIQKIYRLPDIGFCPGEDKRRGKTTDIEEWDDSEDDDNDSVNSLDNGIATQNPSVRSSVCTLM